MNTAPASSAPTRRDAPNMRAYFLTSETHNELRSALLDISNGKSVRIEEDKDAGTFEFVRYTKNRVTGERFRTTFYRALRKDRKFWIVRHVEGMFTVVTSEA